MDTKSRKISYSPVMKGIAFLLAVLCFGFSTAIFGSLLRNFDGLEVLSQRSYLHSRDLYDYQRNFYTGLMNLLKYKDGESIKGGDSINKAELERRKQDLFFEWYHRIDENIQAGDNPQGMDVQSLPGENKIGAYQRLQEKFTAENAEQINRMYNEMVESDLQSYYSLLQRVKNKEGLYYYATNGKNTYTNVGRTDREYFAGFAAYYVSDEQGIKVNPPEKSGTEFAYAYVTDTAMRAAPDTAAQKIYIAVSDAYLEKKQGEWDGQHARLQRALALISVNVLLLLAALLYLVWRAGRSAGGTEIRLLAVDRIYTDINMVAIFGILVAWVLLLEGLLGRGGLLQGAGAAFEATRPDFWAIVLLNAVFCGCGLGLALSLIRHFKNGTWLRHSLTYVILSKIRAAIKTLWHAGPVFVKIVAGILAGEILVFVAAAAILSLRSGPAAFLFLLFCAASALGIYYILVKIKPLEEIVNGVQEIKNGRVEHVIEVKGEGILARLALGINTIADGLKNAVQKEMKAERMKSELITNVSHDLKTPLTSIINYVDLLSKEKLAPEAANDYVAVLKQKSEKLKNLTQDLFEISKLQSGSISVEMEKIDASVLVRQSLAELDEQVSASGLEFKVNIREEDTGILADGKRLSRVFENIILNILKYSLANTRVYIQVFTEHNQVIITFKNIANYEMDFGEDEILERFVRGDKARTTDGNGLGLAIAQSYVAACGGTLKISVDGDLFKVTLQFKKAG